MFLLPCNKFFIDQARSGKMAGYLSDPFSLLSMDLDFVLVHINRIRDLRQYTHSSLTLN